MFAFRPDWFGFCQTSRCYPNCTLIQPRLNVTPEIIQKSYLAFPSGRKVTPLLNAVITSSLDLHRAVHGVDSPVHLFYIAEEMKRGELLGSLEHIILLALVRLDGSAHGMIVRREIEERTGRNISIGAVYATLERLEAKGYVSSSTGDPTPERGGRAKRVFRVEAAGNRALKVSEQTLHNMTADPKGRWETI
jgi:PadR family transcriptional regulator PadR